MRRVLEKAKFCALTQPVSLSPAALLLLCMRVWKFPPRIPLLCSSWTGEKKKKEKQCFSPAEEEQSREFLGGNFQTRMHGSNKAAGLKETGWQSQLGKRLQNGHCQLTMPASGTSDSNYVSVLAQKAIQHIAEPLQLPAKGITTVPSVLSTHSPATAPKLRRLPDCESVSFLADPRNTYIQVHPKIL